MWAKKARGPADEKKFSPRYRKHKPSPILPFAKPRETGGIGGRKKEGTTMREKEGGKKGCGQSSGRTTILLKRLRKGQKHIINYEGTGE